MSGFTVSEKGSPAIGLSLTNEWTQAFTSPYRNDKSVQTVPRRREVLNESKANHLQYEFHTEDGSKNVVEYFQRFAKRRLLMQMDVFKYL